MLAGKRIVVVLPAYNAAKTLKQTYDEIPRDVVDDILLTDDASRDETTAIAQELGIPTLRHPQNRGYGGNQKTCYARALAGGADIVVMLHPDYQYSPRLVIPMAGMIAYNVYDMVLGSRILAQNALDGGMPRYKYVANRGLTFFENVVVSSKLSEYHTGLRAFSRELLLALPVDRNSDDFVFDNQMLVQALAARARIGEVSCPTRYEPNSSSINFRRSVRYGLGVVNTSLQYWLHQRGSNRYDYLNFPPIERRSPDRPSRAPDRPSRGGSVGEEQHVAASESSR
jgi:glycosyltransferase involved in cell wall biosynthesis